MVGFSERSVTENGVAFPRRAGTEAPPNAATGTTSSSNAATDTEVPSNAAKNSGTKTPPPCT